jgi:GntR family transcriptional regulator/MocR family aminotransferase
MAISVDTFFLDPHAQGTLQAQIQQMVTAGVLSGRLARGEKLPSSRKLAAHLGVSRLTVTLAYTELVASDYLSARGRSGYYVSDTAPEPAAEPPQLSRDDAVDWSRAIGQKFSGGVTPERPKDWTRFRFPFIYGQTDPALFDHTNWRACALRALGQKDFMALTTDYYDQDDPQLIEYILRNTLPRRGIIARPSEVLLTLGAQNALWLAAQVLLTQRRVAVVENPCYPALRDVLDQSRCHMAPVDVDDLGLPPDNIPECDVIFTTPSHQCPTASTMPRNRRHRLLQHARDMDTLIVEDDYEFEMSFLSPPSPALKSLDEDGRVIYVGSFSKSLFPGLRLGYLVGSEAFIREARALRASVLRHPPGHIQRTAAYFLSLGHYDAQIRKMTKVLAERRRVMEQVLNEYQLEIAGSGSFGGSSFWMRAPERVNTRQLALELRQKSVLIEAGRHFFSGPDPADNYYRLAYSSIPSTQIRDGIKLIADAINAAR